MQSKDGYLWVGTELGLARFDGQHFTVFDKSNTPELKSNKITTLLEDHVGNLWIGTPGGLTRLRSGQFQTFTSREGLSGNSIRCLLEDATGDLWIGTASTGVNRLHNGKFSVYTSKNGLADDQVVALERGPADTIWIGTHNGLSSFSEGSFRTYRVSDGLANNYVRSLLTTPQGVLWIGTDGGLSRLEGGRFSNLFTKDGLSSNSVQCLTLDASGNLWIGTFSGGITLLSKTGLSSYAREDGLPSRDIWAIYRDRNGDLWIGTGGDGLIQVDTRTLLTTYGTQEGMSSNVALGTIQDREGTFWIATNGGGIDRFKNGEFSSLTVRDGLADNFVLTLCEDAEGAIWAGTRHGLSRFQKGRFTTFDKKDGIPGSAAVLYTDTTGAVWIGTRAGLTRWSNQHFTTFTTQDGLTSNIIRVLYEDKMHRLWIGTGGGGLNVYENGRFRAFTSHSGLSSDVVFALHESAEGTLWIGTDGGGLNRLQNGRLVSFGTKDGLLDDAVFQILEDDQGALWMSSNKGIARVQRSALDEYAAGRLSRIPILTYGTAEGMRTRECNGAFQPAGLKARDGHLWFPTMKGVVVVDPSRMSKSVEQQTTIIETAMVNQHSFPVGMPLKVPVGGGNLEFHYSAPNFRFASRIAFDYRLRGFDPEWVHAGSRRIAYYTNIPPGPYRFEVRATNENNSWSSAAATLPLTLEPHFYQTFLFYTLCSLGAIGMGGFGHREYVRQLRERERTLEQHVHQRTAELRKEIAERELAQSDSLKATEAAERASRVKSEFLANMSHEIRTPMNGILGMTRLTLATKLDTKQRQFLEIIKDSTDSLLIVIDDILDFSKVEAGKLELNPIDFNLRESVEAVIRSLAFRAELKEVSLSLHIEPDVPETIHSDPVRLRQVVLNLLGNALKFTNRGEVSITISCDDRGESEAVLRFVVRDTGIGIAADKLTSIFEAFSQADSSTTRKYGGTGLGLTICYRLVQLMRGRIWATSEVGQGSQFHFTTKVGVVAAEESSAAKPALDPDSQLQSLTALADVCGSDKHILLAEDNPANRMVARYTLEAAGFKVMDVQNGSEAVNAAKRFTFDLILMDCRMPVMDGYVATEKIRALGRPAGQTPIIALTASAFREDRDRAERAGMNDFIAKPFEDGELISKCVQWTRRQEGADTPLDTSMHTAVNPSSAVDLSRFDRYPAEFLREVMELFLESSPPVFDKFISAVHNGEWKAACESAHWLRGGASRMLGPELQQQLQSFESRCREGSPDLSEETVATISRLFTEARITAESWLGAYRSDIDHGKNSSDESSTLPQDEEKTFPVERQRASGD